LTPRFSASRTVREYTEQHYLPAAATYRDRAANKGAAGREMVEWLGTLKQKWAALRFGDVRIETDGMQHVFHVQVYLNGLDPDDVQVELYAEAINGSGPLRQEMTRMRQSEGVAGSTAYLATTPATRPAADYTARVMPHHDGVAVPLETAQILWQR
jgi:glycogen phosphorylase